MTKEDKQIIERGIKENWRIGDRTRLKHLLEKNLKLYRENVKLEGCLLAEQENTLMLENQIEKMKCCYNCKSFKGYGETCEGWGEPVLNLNCDCTEWELKEIEK